MSGSLHRLSVALLGILATAAGPGCKTNHPPVMQPIEETTFYVGSFSEVTIWASDPDGDRLVWDFLHPVGEKRDPRNAIERRLEAQGDFDGTQALARLKRTGRARLHEYIDHAVFKFKPVGEDLNDSGGAWRFDFIVSDGTDTDTQPAKFHIREAPSDAESVPQFEYPVNHGAIFNVENDPNGCFETEIRIKDSDSPGSEIKIWLAEPKPDNAELSNSSGKTTRFKFCPSAAQQRKRSQWTFYFMVQDEENPAQSFKDGYTVTLRDRTYNDPDPNATELPRRDVNLLDGGEVVWSLLEDDGGEAEVTTTNDWECDELPTTPNVSEDPSCVPETTPPTETHRGAKDKWLCGTILNGCYGKQVRGNNGRHGTRNGGSCENTEIDQNSTLTLSFLVPAISEGEHIGLRYWQWYDVFLPYDWTEIRIRVKDTDDSEVYSQRCGGTYVRPTRGASGWEQQQILLDAYEGKDVELTFHFMASELVNKAGWYIDDIELVRK